MNHLKNHCRGYFLASRPLKQLAAAAQCDLRLIAFSVHLAHELGQTIEQFRLDGFVVEGCIECLLSPDTLDYWKIIRQRRY